MRSSPSVLALSLAVLVLASGLAAGGGFYVTGVGPRATAMGGAFIGLADDYSAVHWNPAGIVQIEGMEATVSAQDIISLASREGATLFEGHRGVINEYVVDDSLLVEVFEIVEYEDGDKYVLRNHRATAEANHRIAPGVFFYADPGPLRGFKVGLAAYTLADYGSTWDAYDVADETQFHFYNYDATFVEGGVPLSYESRIRGYVISPVIAAKVAPNLSFGVAAHALYSHFELTTGAYYDSTQFVDNPGQTPDELHLHLYPSQLTEDLTGWGYGATLGALYSLNEDVSLGLSVRTPITVKLEGGVQVDSPLPRLRAGWQPEGFELTYPATAGIGVAYRDFPLDGLTMTADVTWTQWSAVDRIARNVTTELPGVEDGLSTDLGVTELMWDNTFEFGVGFDYRLSRTTSLYLGYRRSPTPAPDDTYEFVLPQADKDVVGVGLGYRSDLWRMDFSLEYQMGSAREFDVRSPVFTLGAVEDVNDKFFEDVMIPSLSFTYGF